MSGETAPADGGAASTKRGTASSGRDAIPAGSSPEEAESAEKFVPPEPSSLDDLRAAAADCRGCRLYRSATQTVFGRGSQHARVILVGEQPGDMEDRKGLPFVGPAGSLLHRAATEAGLDPGELYLTNAVKHFKFSRSAGGKRRLHKTPGQTEIQACRPWLLAEFALLRPEIIVALGATAAKAMLGPEFRVTRSRGKLLAWPDSAQHPQDFPVQPARILATIHPSAVLRAEEHELAYDGFLADLKIVADALS